MVKNTAITLDGVSSFILSAMVLLTLLLPNGFYLFICLLTFILLFFQVQRPYRVGVFTLILLQHFLQIITSVIQSNYLGKDINFRSSENDTAIFLSLIGMVALLLPVIYFQNKLPLVGLANFKESAYKLSTQKAMYFYIAAFFITSTLNAVAFLYPGITQIIFSLVKIKWLFFLLFGFLAIIKKEKLSLFYVFIFLEILLGFFSYFSDFKTVIYFVVILLASFIVVIDAKNIIYALVMGAVVVTFALLWTSVKGQYRSFLNAGKGQQTIDVSREDALGKLYSLSNDVDQDVLTNSTKAFLDRLQYTYHFAKTIERVPSIIPYQNGNNWLEVLQFTTTPRFLNPDKPTVDNSVKTTRYTGIQYSTAKKGVSFSLGYFAECYVDFGAWGMVFPLLLIGLAYGKLYHYFITKATPNLLFNYALVGSFFMEFNAYEMDATHLVGRLFACIVTYLVLIQFAFPWAYRALLVQPENNAVMLNPVY